MGSVENDGITALRNFLSKSDCIIPYISENDKYPLWDGEVIIYHKNHRKFNKKNIKGRIPVQIKAKKSSNKSEKTMLRIDNNDLEKYLNDGGLLYIKVIFSTTIDYAIYYKILLPIDIKKILSLDEQIFLEKVYEIEKFEEICNFFLKNKPYQANLINMENIPIVEEEDKIYAFALDKGTITKSLFSESTYFYKEVSEVKIPVNIKPSMILMEIVSEISIGEKIYFQKITAQEDAKKRIIVLNSVLKLTMEEKAINFSIDFQKKETASLADLILAIDFMQDLIEYGSFSVDRKIVHGEVLEKNMLKDINSQYFKNIERLFELIHHDMRNVTIKDIDDNAKNIEFLIRIFIYGENSKIDHKKEKVFLKYYPLFNRLIIVIFSMESDGLYKGYDFCTAKYQSDFFIKSNENEAVPTSRFLALLNREPDLDIRTIIDFYFEEFRYDVLKYYDHRLSLQYNNIMLKLIYAYDATKRKMYMTLAYKINYLLKKSNLDQLSVYLINKYQIKKRISKLKEKDIEKIIEIKDGHPDNFEIKCCALILLESYKEFEIVYKKMEKQKQDDFRTWPIWSLYEGVDA